MINNKNQNAAAANNFNPIMSQGFLNMIPNQGGTVPNPLQQGASMQTNNPSPYSNFNFMNSNIPFVGIKEGLFLNEFFIE